MGTKADEEMKDPNPSDGEDSDSGTSDDDSESDRDTQEDSEDVSLLEARIKSTGGRDYDAFLQLLRIFRDRSQMLELEKLREDFSSSYPLAEGCLSFESFLYIVFMC